MREVFRQRFMWWIWVAFALAAASYFIQPADVPQVRRLVSLVGLVCMVIGLTQFFRWARRVGRI